MRTGPRLAGRVVNHLGYADDPCLISLTSGGMQHLLSCCEQYVEQQDLVSQALVTPDRTIFWSCDFCRFEVHTTDRECLVS